MPETGRLHLVVMLVLSRMRVLNPAPCSRDGDEWAQHRTARAEASDRA
jgi:hypothetical protein